MKIITDRLVLYPAILLFLGFTFFSCNEPESVNDQALNIGSRLELFVDDYLIDHLGGKAKLQLHHPEAKEVSIVHDEPWEGAGSGYHSVFKDGDLYRMYYKSWKRTVSSDGVDVADDIYCAYAESNDGIVWRKPKLGLYDFNGSKDNNIVFIRGIMGGVPADGGHPAIFKDDNPDAPPDALYKAILVYRGEEGAKRGLIAFKSPDGINWTPMTKTPVITDGAFDSQNLVFWDGERKEYRAYWRYFTKGTDESPYQGVRSIRTARSKDMITWSDQKDLAYVDSPSEHLYTNQIKPYYRAPHIYMGFPSRYNDRGWSESMRALPELNQREWRSSTNERYGTAVSETVFMSSRDGVLFKRWNEAFIRPGIERPGSWNYGHQYVGWSFIETKSALGDAPNELSFYAKQNSWSNTGAVMLRHTLRIDGFVSVNAPMSGGELVTKPLIFKGKNLILNFSSSAAGDIRIEIQDPKGKPVPGFSLEDSPPIFGDAIERQAVWKNGSDLSSLMGKPVRLRFVLKDADLYSLRFR